MSSCLNIWRDWLLLIFSNVNVCFRGFIFPLPANWKDWNLQQDPQSILTSVKLFLVVLLYVLIKNVQNSFTLQELWLNVIKYSILQTILQIGESFFFSFFFYFIKNYSLWNKMKIYVNNFIYSRRDCSV